MNEGFGTILFDMVPKVIGLPSERLCGFGTILFDMVPKAKVQNIFTKSVLEPFCLLFSMGPKGRTI